MLYVAAECTALFRPTHSHGRGRDKDMGQVQGKIAIVTGGASGIGAACVETLAREGARVVISDIDDLRGEALAAQIAVSGRDAIYLSHDVTDEARWQEVVGEI